jgi:hypothetical protein
MAAKKATVTQKLESGVPAKIVVLRPSTITNRAWIYVASSAEHLAKWEMGWCSPRLKRSRTDACKTASLFALEAVDRLDHSYRE